MIELIKIEDLYYSNAYVTIYIVHTVYVPPTSSTHIHDTRVLENKPLNLYGIIV